MADLTIVSRDEFAERVRSGDDGVAELQLYKYGALAPVVKVEDSDGDGRTRRFAITSESVDREHDTIALAGWDTANYLNNPVVLWAHDSRSLPIGRAERLITESKLLKADDRFATAEQNPLAENVLQLVDGGFLNATSVGFRALTWSYNEDRGGIDFLTQELLEHSVVPIPANPDALIAAAVAGHDLSAGQK